MTFIVLQLAIFVITFILITLVAVIAVARAVRTAREKRYEARVELLRPVVLQTLSDDEPDTSALDAFTGADATLMEEIAWSMLPKVRGTSREALVAWLQSRGSVDTARKQTTSMGSVRRARAAQRLGAAGLTETAPEVTRLLTDRNQEVRVVAARALGKLGNPDAVPALLDSLEGTRRIPTSLVSMALIHIGPPAIEELMNGLNRRSSWSRMVCADLLGVHGAYQATAPLCDLVVNDMSINVRVRAAGALGRIGAPQGIPALLGVITGHNHSLLRTAATKALGRIGADAVYEPLFELTTDQDAEVAISAAEALASLGRRGQEMLTALSLGDSVAASRARDWLSRSAMESSRVRRRRTVGGRR